jgi:hypothetical protein
MKLLSSALPGSELQLSQKGSMAAEEEEQKQDPWD